MASARTSVYGNTLAPTSTNSANPRDSMLQPNITAPLPRSARTSQATTLTPSTNRNSTLYASESNNKQRQSSGASNSTSSLGAGDDRISADIQSWTGTLSRLQDARLEKQRYVMSRGKNEEVSKLALGAKVERALGRRLVGQDAAFSAQERGRGAPDAAAAAAAAADEKRRVEVQAVAN